MRLQRFEAVPVVTAPLSNETGTEAELTVRPVNGLRAPMTHGVRMVTAAREEFDNGSLRGAGAWDPCLDSLWRHSIGAQGAGCGLASSQERGLAILRFESGGRKPGSEGRTDSCVVSR